MSQTLLPDADLPPELLSCCPLGVKTAADGGRASRAAACQLSVSTGKTSCSTPLGGFVLACRRSM